MERGPKGPFFKLQIFLLKLLLELLMTQPHPLTDEVCDSIAPWPIKRPGEYDCMRTAAEWQLIQVIEFIKKEDTVYAEYIYKAMRPQQQDDN